MDQSRPLKGKPPQTRRAVRLTRRKSRRSGFTLIETLIVVGILTMMAGLAIPAFKNYLDSANNSEAVADIYNMEIDISRFFTENLRLPNNLAEAGIVDPDPWGNPYQYRIVATSPPGALRKDLFLVPLNSDFDLYSMGRDGASQPPLTAAASRDDIIRANNGDYVGPASAY